MKCPKCSHDIPEEAVYCFHCGEKISSDGLVTAFGGQVVKFRRKSER